MNLCDTFSHRKYSLPRISYKMGDPDVLNPNSFYNMLQVIQSIGTKAGIEQCGTGDRE